MTDRIEQLDRDEAFEAWWDGAGLKQYFSVDGKTVARQAWHAALKARPEVRAREAVIEECARYVMTLTWSEPVQIDVAYAIRSLKSKPPMNSG